MIDDSLEARIAGNDVGRDWGKRNDRAVAVCDTAVTLLTLPVWAPSLAVTTLVVAAAIKLEEGWDAPVFYRPTVWTRYGWRRIHKYRSMKIGAHGLYDQMVQEGKITPGGFEKYADDPRVTKVGKFLRKYSLDELPQLPYVLLGYLGLVGANRPQPEKALKNASAQDRETLTEGRPGITSWFQARRGKVSEARASKLYTKIYNSRWILPYNLQIIYETFVGMARGNNC